MLQRSSSHDRSLFSSTMNSTFMLTREAWLWVCGFINYFKDDDNGQDCRQGNNSGDGDSDDENDAKSNKKIT